MINNEDITELMVLNDLSIDRASYRRKIRPIPGTTWYIDNRGEVYNTYGNVAATEVGWDGSLRVRPVYNGRQVYRYVNDLVLRAFVGPPPTKRHRPWHRDGDRSNNCVDNLSWIIYTGDIDDQS